LNARGLEFGEKTRVFKQNKTGLRPRLIPDYGDGVILKSSVKVSLVEDTE
jgi:hypothetical protein